MTPISFEQARAVVAAALSIEGDDRVPALHGWENDSVFVIGFDHPAGEAQLGEEMPVVDRATGQLRWEISAPGEPVAPNLRPISKPLE
jgi:hypothetical protein